MDKEEILFQIIDELNNKNLLFEKNHIIDELEEKKNISKKKINNRELLKTYLFVIIKLENKENIIIKEKPQAFFESYSIILGDSTKLIKAKDEKTNQVYFFEKEHYEDLEKVCSFKEIREVPPQVLHNKTFINPIGELEIIKEIKAYTKKIFNVDLNKIHIVKHNKLELFLPTLNEKHNQIAHTLNIPIKACNKNNFFCNTSLHINDEKKQKELLKPILEKKEKENSTFYEKKEIKKKLITQLYCKIDKKEILSKINSLENTNINIEKVLEILRYKKHIVLGTKTGDIILPIFKHKEFKTFKNKEEFKEEVGLEYKSNKEKLHSILIRKTVDKTYIFKEYYLPNSLKNAINENVSEHLFCETYNEIFLMFSLNIIPKTLTLEENININQINELTKHIFSLAKITIHKSVKENYLPKEKRAQNAIEHYLLSKSSKIILIKNTYTKNHSKKKLLKHTLQTAQQISELNKVIEIEKESIYFLHQCILLYIMILKIFDIEKAKLIEDTLQEYFGKIPLKVLQSKINIKNDTIINDIVLVHKISKKKDYFIDIKDDLYTKYYPQNIIRLPSKNIEQIIYFRANIQKLKEISPYNFATIAKTINGNTLPQIIKIQKKEVPCSKEYYHKTTFHNEYKEIISNEIFSFFVKEK